jgi:hypothetical protein
MSEVNRGTQPWKSHPRRMLRHKALIQCARIAFGFAGIYDEDEAERIVEAQVVESDPVAQKDARLAQACAALQGSISVIKQGIADGELSKAAEAWYELTREEQQSIWSAPSMNHGSKRHTLKNAPFTTAERDVIQSEEFRKSYYTDAEASPDA